jgi:hypothetical protein
MWSVSRPGRFNPRERAPSTHWIGGWVGHRAGLDSVVVGGAQLKHRDTFTFYLPSTPWFQAVFYLETFYVLPDNEIIQED